MCVAEGGGGIERSIPCVSYTVNRFHSKCCQEMIDYFCTEETEKKPIKREKDN